MNIRIVALENCSVCGYRCGSISRRSCSHIVLTSRICKQAHLRWHQNAGAMLCISVIMLLVREIVNTHLSRCVAPSSVALKYASMMVRWDFPPEAINVNDAMNGKGVMSDGLNMFATPSNVLKFYDDLNAGIGRCRLVRMGLRSVRHVGFRVGACNGQACVDCCWSSHLSCR